MKDLSGRPGAGIVGYRRGDLRLLDALYVELAARLGVRVLTTDHRLARATPLAEAITGPS